MSINNNNLTETIIEAIRDVKGHNIAIIDTSGLLSAPTDTFIIAEGNSPTQVSAISEKIFDETTSKLRLRPTTIQGRNNASWVIIDYGNVIVHVFLPDTRKFYDIEQLWSDGVIKMLPDD